jgi:diaminohydroxyphosphoribosylaminopyrimidine deaminase/5-amino-6-(5-phosphoribosylamino)uracil reductase
MIDIWDVIVNIRTKLRYISKLPKEIILSFDGEVNFDGDAKDACLLIYISNETEKEINPLQDCFFELEVLNRESIHNCQLELEQLKFYLPFAFSSFFGRKYQKCYSISHFAQTLDGKIATNLGDSKWIGNEENLIHAHKMRALCDGILVGAKTLEIDNPKLNVRKVLGDNPVKIILGGNGTLSSGKYNAIEPSSIVFKCPKKLGNSSHCIEISEDSPFNLHNILNQLVNKKIYSVYIEGGSYTTSSFLEQNALDQVQIHFSSKILGSGLNAFEFGNIAKIRDATVFKSGRFIPIGDEMMFIGNL